MKSVVFRIAGAEFVITREKILAAMKAYDLHYRNQSNDIWRKYAVKHDGKLYPPKPMLRLAIGMSRASFSGGEGKNAANLVFRKLGFEIVSVGNNRFGTTKPSKSVADQAKLNIPIPTMPSLVSSLLSKKWTNLHANYHNLEDGKYPGVYILAYSDEELEGKPIKEEEVYYVGMSHAGIKKRLHQFINGIEDGEHHSGAGRFFKTYANRIPYSQLPSKKTFFVASMAIPCITSKHVRSSEDLKKMGEVARFEFYVLAHIKEKLHVEPELNKK